MVDITLSDAEKAFITGGVEDNFRADGRACDDYRDVILETGLMTNTNGSSRLTLANTEVLVGIKLELGKPALQKPDAGILNFFLDCSANATPKFEGRGGENLAAQITNLLQRAYKTKNVLNLKSLCLCPEKLCWIVNVDIVLLECGGNLYDAVSLAVKAALFNLQIPRVEVEKEQHEDLDLILPDNPYDVCHLDVSSTPIVITLTKIGKDQIVDATQKEAACALASLMVSVAGDGLITAVLKAGEGSLHPESVLEMMEIGRRVGMRMNKLLMETLREEASKGIKRKTVGFQR